MYYAELDTTETIDDPRCYEQEVQIGGIDLWRFSTKKERNLFVSEHQNANTITAISARETHTEQFRYWLTRG